MAMKRIHSLVYRFLEKQSFVVVATIDKKGRPHTACKDIIKIEQQGRIFLLDLYKATTFENLRRNRSISVTAVDEHAFKGFCLKGKAREIAIDRFAKETMELWNKKIASRVTHRLLKNIRGEKGHLSHPEAQLPKPEYMIAMDVEEIINLTPPRLIAEKRLY